MIHNYLKTSLRNIKRHKIYTGITTVGLALGITCCLLIMLWIQDELSFDRFHAHAGDIHRVLQEQNFTDHHEIRALTPPPLGPALMSDFPEVLRFSRYTRFVGDVSLAYGEHGFYESGGGYVDPEFFSIFSFPFLSGDPETALSGIFSIIMTEETASKYFKNEDPIGKNVRLENICDLTVTGIIENVPENSHLDFDFLVPLSLLEKWGTDLTDWEAYPHSTYIQLQPGTDTDALTEKISGYLKTIDADSRDRLLLQSLTRIHLHSHFAWDIHAVLGNFRYISIMSLIAIFILLLACINFINLTTARSMNRAMEVGIRKVLGGDRRDLIRQFFCETFVLTLSASLAALLLIELSLPAFNRFTGKHLNFHSWNPDLILGSVILIVITGFLAGAYPALFLASFSPIHVLKRLGPRMPGRSLRIRNGLVVFQFVLAVGLLICTLTVFNQLRYIRTRQMNDARNPVVAIQSRGGMIRHFASFKQELLRHPEILSVSAVSQLIHATPMTSENVDWQGKNLEANQSLSALFVNFDYLETMGLELKSGRDFSRERPTDATRAFILNEQAAKLLEWESPLDKEFAMGDRRGTIIGIVKDYHFDSLHHKINPLVLQVRPRECRYLLIKIKGDRIPQGIATLGTAWKRFIPHFPFDYRFRNENVAAMYRNEIRLGRMFIVFTVLAIAICCLGLFGLAAFMTEQRSKEIGIRKILGATSGRIVLMFTAAFSKWIFIANLIAWPLAYFAMQRWLRNFAYHTSLDIASFFIAAATAFIVALITVSFQTIKAAASDPVNSLRYE